MASDWLEVPENRRRFIQHAKSLGVVTLDEYESPSANSTGGHLDLDFTDYSGGGGRKLNFAERQRTMSNVRSKLRQRRAAEKERIDNFTDGMINTIYSWQQQGVPRAQAEQQIRQMAGANIAMGKEMLNALDYFYSGDSKGMESWQIDAVNDALAAGQFQNSQEYIQYLQRSGANQKQLMKQIKRISNGATVKAILLMTGTALKPKYAPALKAMLLKLHGEMHRRAANCILPNLQLKINISLHAMNLWNIYAKEIQNTITAHTVTAVNGSLATGLNSAITAWRQAASAV